MCSSNPGTKNPNTTNTPKSTHPPSVIYTTMIDYHDAECLAASMASPTTRTTTTTPANMQPPPPHSSHTERDQQHRPERPSHANHVRHQHPPHDDHRRRSDALTSAGCGTSDICDGASAAAGATTRFYKFLAWFSGESRRTGILCWSDAISVCQSQLA